MCASLSTYAHAHTPSAEKECCVASVQKTVGLPNLYLKDICQIDFLVFIFKNACLVCNESFRLKMMKVYGLFSEGNP